jgi:uncharacterized membrane protein YozB (DUF420 family)
VTIHDFPPLNATLNGTSAVLLTAGFIFIKLKKIRAHQWCMIAAVITSTAFLACYLTYHYVAGEKSSGLKPSTLRTVYYSILFPHLILAVVMLPLIFLTFLRAYRQQWDKHRKIAVIAFPIWLYVSVTGVIIYWMLYHYIPGAMPR